MIGETAVVGDDVTLYQGVTLGGTGKPSTLIRSRLGPDPDTDRRPVMPSRRATRPTFSGSMRGGPLDRRRLRATLFTTDGVKPRTG